MNNLNTEKLLELISQGKEAWNEWKKKPRTREINLYRSELDNRNLSGYDFSGVIFHGAFLGGSDLRHSNLSGAKLDSADLMYAKLSKADLSGADFNRARLDNADLSNVKLNSASLFRADLSGANLTGADLSGANLRNAILIGTNIEQAIITNCSVYGLSAWDLKGIPKDQSDLIITPSATSQIRVGDLRVAQFIYSLLDRNSIRNVINTITSKAVLILGRFTPERKAVLDAMAYELQKNGLLPIIFDFDRPTSRDFSETIKILAGMSLFVIADITSPKSSPLELQATVPDYQIPFVPIIQEKESPFSMLSDLIGKHDWVLPLVKYSTIEQLKLGFREAIIDRAVNKHQELQIRKNAEIKVLSMEDFLQKSK